MIEQKQKSYWINTAKILSNMKRFKKEVLKARKELEIPLFGIPKKDRATWYQTMHSQADIDLKKQFGLNSIYELLPPNKKFMQILTALAKKFNLDERWYSSLFFYLASGDNELEPPYEEMEIFVCMNDSRLPEEQLRVTQLWINIKKDTTLDDLKNIMGKIQKYQDKMEIRVPKKRRPIKQKNVDRYLHICKLENEGKKQSEIADILEFSSAKEVSEFKKEIQKRFSPQK